MMTFEQFVSFVDHDFHTNELRYGQTLMNKLSEVWPEKYKELTHTDNDCFYDDATVRFTLSKLEQDWKNERPI